MEHNFRAFFKKCFALKKQGVEMTQDWPQRLPLGQFPFLFILLLFRNSIRRLTSAQLRDIEVVKVKQRQRRRAGASAPRKVICFFLMFGWITFRLSQSFKFTSFITHTVMEKVLVLWHVLGMSLACPYSRVVVWTLYDQKLKSLKSQNSIPLRQGPQ